jgi:phosphatidate cytidylyltransferase
MTDTFAYLTGRMLGRHKLAPRVSPHKTVEGAIGGIVGCVASMLVYAPIAAGIWGSGWIRRRCVSWAFSARRPANSAT